MQKWVKSQKHNLKPGFSDSLPCSNKVSIKRGTVFEQNVFHIACANGIYQIISGLPASGLQISKMPDFSEQQTCLLEQVYKFFKGFSLKIYAFLVKSYEKSGFYKNATALPKPLRLWMLKNITPGKCRPWESLPSAPSKKKPRYQKIPQLKSVI